MLASVSWALLAAVGDLPAAPVVGLMALGVVMAVVGHAGKDRRVVIVGLGLLFLATLLLFVVGYFAFNAGDLDPRTPANPRDAAY